MASIFFFALILLVSSMDKYEKRQDNLYITFLFSYVYCVWCFRLKNGPAENKGLKRFGDSRKTSYICSAKGGL